MDKSIKVEIAPFRPEDQQPVQALIQAGLAAYWGVLDHQLNQDLVNITESYREGIFLVARLDGEIAGTGAFIPHFKESVEVVRMWVAKDLRGKGIGRQILSELCRRAYQCGYKQVILETTATWHRAIAFYRSFGFHITHTTDGDVHFALNLQTFFQSRP